MTQTYTVGDVVRYAHPVPGEHDLTFTVVELRGDRVLLVSRDFTDSRFTPTEVVALDEVTRA